MRYFIITQKWLIDICYPKNFEKVFHINFSSIIKCSLPLSDSVRCGDILCVQRTLALCELSTALCQISKKVVYSHKKGVTFFMKIDKCIEFEHKTWVDQGHLGSK